MFTRSLELSRASRSRMQSIAQEEEAKDMSGQKCQRTVNGTGAPCDVVQGAASAGQAVTATVTDATARASGDVLADARCPCESEDSFARRATPNMAVATTMTPVPKWLVLPARRIVRTSSGERQDAHTQAMSHVKNHVAQTLHETVMQTLVATIYLAESPSTSRRDLVEYLRQATHELRCVIEGLAALESDT